MFDQSQANLSIVSDGVTLWGECYPQIQSKKAGSIVNYPYLEDKVESKYSKPHLPNMGDRVMPPWIRVQTRPNVVHKLYKFLEILWMLGVQLGAFAQSVDLRSLVC